MNGDGASRQTSNSTWQYSTHFASPFCSPPNLRREAPHGLVSVRLQLPLTPEAQTAAPLGPLPGGEGNCNQYVTHSRRTAV